MICLEPEHQSQTCSRKTDIAYAVLGSAPWTVLRCTYLTVKSGKPFILGQHKHPWLGASPKCSWPQKGASNWEHVSQWQRPSNSLPRTLLYQFLEMIPFPRGGYGPSCGVGRVGEVGSALSSLLVSAATLFKALYPLWPRSEPNTGLTCGTLM